VAPTTCEVLDAPGIAAESRDWVLTPSARTETRRWRSRTCGAPEDRSAALLDQGLIAGVGNVCRSEALHAVHVAPQRSGREMTHSELRGLWHVLQHMMTQAV